MATRESKHMGRVVRILLVTMLAAFGIGQLRAQPPSPVLDVTYLEVRSESEVSAVALLKRHRDAGRQEPGNVKLDVLRQRDRPGHFVILEAWRDQPSLDQHAATVLTKTFFDAVQAIRVSAVDQRLFKSLAVGAVVPPSPAGTIHIVTHVDTIPNPQHDATALLTRHAEESRQDDGNFGFDVFQQTTRSNHFAIVEIWKDGAALDRHQAAPHTKRYRDDLQRLLGSPIDERLFTVIN